ncbi:hypothetical protein GQ53DRAFT_829040 [Thozetella sp. PMI_491]|nr:hypothetical protein GQ53DRAFT_829040 [Thozetella sp. PMI_491]
MRKMAFAIVTANQKMEDSTFEELAAGMKKKGTSAGGSAKASGIQASTSKKPETASKPVTALAEAVAALEEAAAAYKKVMTAHAEAMAASKKAVAASKQPLTAYAEAEAALEEAVTAHEEAVAAFKKAVVAFVEAVAASKKRFAVKTKNAPNSKRIKTAKKSGTKSTGKAPSVGYYSNEDSVEEKTDTESERSKENVNKHLEDTPVKDDGVGHDLDNILAKKFGAEKHVENIPVVQKKTRLTVSELKFIKKEHGNFKSFCDNWAVDIGDMGMIKDYIKVFMDEE